jgi:putative ABC transport system substrate-binding protein
MRRRDLLLAGLGGMAAASPVRAQHSVQPKRLGLLMSTAEAEAHERSAVIAFVQALEKLGWTAGRNVEITYRWGAGDAGRMAANAREIVGLAPDVIVTKGANLPALAKLTRTIPIVFVLLSDAVAERYVGSLARPGGNITGFTSGERDLVGKRLQLLREIDPRIRRALYIRSRQVGSDTNPLFQSLAADAAASGIAVTDGAMQQAADIEGAVAAFAREPDGGLIIAFDAFNTTYSALIVRLATKYRLPAVYPIRFFADAGGLLSYGFDQDGEFRKAASYADRILKGAKPANLPVQRPTRFQLVINGTAAKALGLAVPPLLLAQADEVIE